MGSLVATIILTMRLDPKSRSEGFGVFSFVPDHAKKAKKALKLLFRNHKVWEHIALSHQASIITLAIY